MLGGCEGWCVDGGYLFVDVGLLLVWCFGCDVVDW